ncbi:MAG: hypothetical protein ACMUHB_03285 [Thermoplasmatota archaeon]
MEDTQIDEGSGFMQRLKNLFSSRGEEQTEIEDFTYSRKLLDGRIEKYLDQNMDAYIEEYRVLTQLDLDVYEDRYSNLTSRISGMSEFMLDVDATVSAMENELEQVKKASRKKK